MIFSTTRLKLKVLDQPSSPDSTTSDSKHTHTRRPLLSSNLSVLFARKRARLAPEQWEKLDATHPNIVFVPSIWPMASVCVCVNWPREDEKHCCCIGTICGTQTDRRKDRATRCQRHRSFAHASDGSSIGLNTNLLNGFCGVCGTRLCAVWWSAARALVHIDVKSIN